MILVTGASGRLGTELVARLQAMGCDVRVMTRDPSRVVHLGDVDVVEGDVRRPETLAAAVSGVDVVISAIHGFAGSGRGVSPEAVDHLGNVSLIEAAERAAVARFVMMSVVGASASSPMELFRAKYAAEQRLLRSQLEWTVVRATAFMETWTGLIGDSLQTKGKALVFGRGDNPINFVSVRDVATLVSLAAVDASTTGRILELGGPDNLTFNEVATMLLRQAGAGGVRHVPRPALRVMSRVVRPIQPVLARQAAAAVIMDTVDMTFDSTPVRDEFPTLPCTTLQSRV
jgi:uncharacterized protein YbjT (DUF2867 family)